MYVSGLADELRRRLRALGITQADLSRSADVSPDTIRKLAGGHTTSIRTRTRESLEQALGWEIGSVNDILDGGTPTEVKPPQEEGDVIDRIEAKLDEVITLLTEILAENQ